MDAIVIGLGAILIVSGVVYGAALVASGGRHSLGSEGRFKAVATFIAGRVLLGLAFVLAPFTSPWISVTLVVAGILATVMSRRMGRRPASA